MKRKEFIRIASSAMVLLANGSISKAVASSQLRIARSKVLFRFAVASDGHYGQPDTDYASYFKNIVTSINLDHAENPFRFAVINGDIVHDDKSHFPAAKAALDELKCRYYVSQGNHDNVNAAEWESIWGMPVNLDFTYKKYAFLVATTSNEKGEYLCPDLAWMKEKLEAHKNKDVFIFIHINPGKLTTHAIDCPELFQLFAQHKNIRAVFNGHDHDEDNIKKKNDIPFVFDSHFGGSWGTSYKGYRVVEVMKDGSVITYIMNPATELNRMTLEGSFRTNAAK